MNLPELLHPDFESNAKRVQNREKLLKILKDEFKKHDLEHWRHTLRQKYFPSGPVNNIAEAFDHEQVKHLQLVQETTHKTYGTVKTVGNTTTYSTIENNPRSAPPMLGEHTKEVFADELGLSTEELERLEEEGIIA